MTEGYDFIRGGVSRLHADGTMVNSLAAPAQSSKEGLGIVIDSWTERIVAIEEQLADIARTLEEIQQHLLRDEDEEDESEDIAGIVGHPGHTDQAHWHTVCISINDVKGQPISLRTHRMQNRSGVAFHFGSTPMPTMMLGSIDIQLED
jgi:hypothetical protein